LEHLVGTVLSQDHIHIALIRTLNRNLHVVYPEVSNETEPAFTRALEKGKQENGGQVPRYSTDVTDLLKGWISVKGLEFVSELVYGLNQRVFVGLPLCK
jgi:hypothetical protein